MRVSILLCFIISLALTTIYLSLPVDADNNEITLDKTDNNAQVSDQTTNNDIEQANQNKDDSILTHEESTKNTVNNEVYAQTQLAPDLLLERDEYETDRFIIKYKSENGKSNIAGFLNQDIKTIKNFKNNNFKEFNIVTTKTKMKKDDFIAKLKNQAEYNEIEYIQPDYKLTAASIDSATNTLQDSLQMQNKDLPEFFQGLPSDDPILVDWLKNQLTKKQLTEETQEQDNNTSTTKISADETDAGNISGQNEYTPSDSEPIMEVPDNTQLQYENLPEFLQGLPLNDPILIDWLKNQSTKKQAPGTA